MRSGFLAIAVALAACGGGQASAPSSAPSRESTTASTPSSARAAQTTAASEPLSNTAPAQAPAPAAKARQPSRDDALAMLQMFSDQMCACHDKPCADAVNDRMMEWGQWQARNARANAEREIDAKQVASVVEQLSACMTNIFTAAAQAPQP